MEDNEGQRDVEDPNPSSPRISNSRPNRSACSSSITLAKWKKAIEICIVLLALIVGAILLYCLLTLGTVVVVSIFVLINSVLHMIDSAKGDAGSMKVVTPISHMSATVILLLAIVTLSVWLGIVHAVEDWKNHSLLDVQAGKWLQVVIIVLGYYSFRTSTQIIMVRQEVPPWLQGLVDGIHYVSLLPTVVLICKVVPSWKHYPILGLPTWDWICALILVIFGQNVISLAAWAMVLFSRLYCRGPEYCKSRKCMFYYMKGLRQSITFVLVALMHLLTWKLHYRHHFTRSAVTDKVLYFGKWTFVSELILGILLGIKNVVLLSWKAHTVYARSDKEIMRKWTHWYCLSSIELIKLKDEQEPEDENNSVQPNETTAPGTQPDSLRILYNFINSALRNLQKNILVDTKAMNKETTYKRKEKKWKATLKQLKDAVKYYSDKARDKQDQDSIVSIHVKEMIAWAFLPDVASLPEDQDLERRNNNSDKDTSNPDHKREISQEELIEGDRMPEQSIYDQFYINKLDKVAKKILDEQLNDISKNAQAGVSTETFKIWVDRARENCSQLQNLHTAASDALNLLNRLMIGFIIVLVIIIWLLLTETLQTKVIVAISSPLLGATFIFGDTIKTMFQGIIFAYIMQPFTIGDLCVIDQTLMEVKRNGIWGTTFSKVGTEEEVLYPNSTLASQAIINYAVDIDLILKDSVEFSVDLATKWRTINGLKDSIKRITIEELGQFQHKPKGAVEEESQGSVPNGSDKGNSTLAGLEQNDMKDTESSGSELHSLGPSATDNDQIEEINHQLKIGSDSEPGFELQSQGSVEKVDNEIEELDNEPVTGSEPSPQVEPLADQENIAQPNAGDHVEVVIKQIQDNIKMTVYFPHDRSILDMTNTKAFNKKMERKSNILEAIAHYLNDPHTSSSTQNVEEVPGMPSILKRGSFPVAASPDAMGESSSSAAQVQAYSQTRQGR